MEIAVTVIICTHNPREDYLQRVLDALKTQTFPSDQWELLFIDNASKEPLAQHWDLGWNRHARHIREEELGLTAARLRGIVESTGELLIFVDDDNILAQNYLERAVAFAEDCPHLGAFGGSVKGEFEIQPPDWVTPYLSGLAICEIDQDYWSNLPIWSKAVPYGAGLCVRREVANDYACKVTADPKRRALGRTGAGMAAGDDTDLAWCAIDLGMGTGRLFGLKLTHLIPKSRLTIEYITRLYAGFSGSSLLLDSLRGIVIPARKVPLVELLRFIYALARASPVQRRLLFAARSATKRARAVLDKPAPASV